MRLWIPVVAALLLARCGGPEEQTCSGLCPPAVTLEIVDASSGEVLSGGLLKPAPPGFTCIQGHCQGGLQPGTYDLAVGAPGYATSYIRVVVPAAPEDSECAGCGYLSQDRTVPLTPGCNDAVCGACRDGITLTVVDAASGASIGGASATAAQACSCELGSCHCTLSTVGTHQVTVSAEGYESQTLSLTVTEAVNDPLACCGGCLGIPPDRDVLLSPQQ